MNDNFYLIALGSNQRHHWIGPPRAVIASALAAMEASGAEIVAESPIVANRPIGPSQRNYANAAALVRSDLDPDAMLEMLQGVELSHARRRQGQRWRARTLDLDIVLWSGGIVAEAGLQIPHPQFRQRAFVTAPAAAVVPHWRDPVTGLTMRQINARLTRQRPLPR